MNKYVILFCLLIACWSNVMADSMDSLNPVEITLRTGESYSTLDVTVTLLEARTKWTESGDSALSVSLEVKNKRKIEILYLTRISREISTEDWETITINLLNGDNGLVELAITAREIY